MIRLYIIGLCILLIAILANAVILKTGIKTWYDFIGVITEDGFLAFSKLNILDYLWLFIGYPFVLALGYVLGDKIYSFFT